MEIVIKINENTWKRICDGQSVPDMLNIDIVNGLNAIKNGTPLPKGHGDLISKEQAIELVEFYQLNPQHFDFVNLIDEIKDEKPIIKGSDTE